TRTWSARAPTCRRWPRSRRAGVEPDPPDAGATSGHPRHPERLAGVVLGQPVRPGRGGRRSGAAPRRGRRPARRRCPVSAHRPGGATRRGGGRAAPAGAGRGPRPAPHRADLGRHVPARGRRRRGPLRRRAGQRPVRAARRGAVRGRRRARALARARAQPRAPEGPAARGPSAGEPRRALPRVPRRAAGADRPPRRAARAGAARPRARPVQAARPHDRGAAGGARAAPRAGRAAGAVGGVPQGLHRGAAPRAAPRAGRGHPRRARGAARGGRRPRPGARRALDRRVLHRAARRAAGHRGRARAGGRGPLRPPLRHPGHARPRRSDPRPRGLQRRAMDGTVLEPLLVDLYELTMAEAYRRGSMAEVPASFSLYVRTLPPTRPYLVAAGLADALDWLEALRFGEDELAALDGLGVLPAELLDLLADFRFTGTVRAVPEGTIVFAEEPLLEVDAPLLEAQLAETFLLNQVTLQTNLATTAARCRAAADGRSVVDFSL